MVELPDLGGLIIGLLSLAVLVYMFIHVDDLSDGNVDCIERERDDNSRAVA